MSINHHLDDSTIVNFAAGALPSAFAIVASAHLDECPQCRQAVRRAETVGGATLDAIAPVALSPEAANNLLELVDAEERKADRGAARTEDAGEASGDEMLSPAVASLIGAPLSEIRWKRAGRGISTYQIDLGDQASSKLFLMKIAGGRAVPEHGHSGHEVTLILSGAYNDAFGRFARGDVADLDPEMEHQPVVEEGEDCVCLVAVERPARFKKLLPRLFQPMVGI